MIVFRLFVLVAAAMLTGCGAAVPHVTSESAASEWIALFDGKTLDGWRTSGSAVWRVEDGVIVGGQDGDPRKSGVLVSEREFKDFELELEFMIDEHGKYNSGVFFRRPRNPRKGQPGSRGYQVNIGRGAAGEPVGLYLDDWLDKGDEHDKVRKPLKWNKLRILARGPHIVVHLNGQKIVDYTHPNPEPHLLGPGTLAFQTYGAEGHAGWVKFRNVRVRPIEN